MNNPKGRAARRGSRALIVALFAAVLWLGGVIAVEAAPGEPSHLAGPGIGLAPTETAGLAVTATTTYRLNVKAKVVHVRVEATIENTKPPSFSGYYYFNQFGVSALGPVANARGHQGDASLNTTIEGDETGWQHVVVTLNLSLLYGAPQDLVIEYDLPAQDNGSDSPNRVNNAFASWFVVSTGDNGSGHVVVDVPARFELEAGTPLSGDSSVNGDRRTLEFRKLDELDGFFGVSARDDNKLVERSAQVDDDSYIVRAWPSDKAWADFAIDAVKRGIPELVDFIGLEVDDEREFEIIETATPYIYGYAGWYDRIEDLIEIGDDRDLHVILHELSHIWFHGGLFDDRWLLEGLAEVASNRVAKELGEEGLPPEALDRSAPGAVALTQWEDTPIIEGGAESESYGYTTSYAVMDSIVKEIGDDTLRTVLERADANEIPLTGDPDPELFTTVTDWRYFFDLVALETNPKAVREILTQYVLTDDEAGLFKSRRKAMGSYGELVTNGNEWSPPFAVRRSLANWDFAQANSAMKTAQDILDLRAELEQILEPVDGTSLHGLEDAYETAERPHVLTGIAEDRDAYLGAAQSLADIERRVDGASPIARLGLWGRTDDDLGAAAEAFGDGDFDEVESRLESVDGALDDAIMIAAVRTVPTVAVIGLWVSVVILIRRRRAHRGLEPASSASELTDSVDHEPSETTDDRPVDPDELKVSAE